MSLYLLDDIAVNFPGLEGVRPRAFPVRGQCTRTLEPRTNSRYPAVEVHRPFVVLFITIMYSATTSHNVNVHRQPVADQRCGMWNVECGITFPVATVFIFSFCCHASALSRPVPTLRPMHPMDAACRPVMRARLSRVSVSMQPEIINSRGRHFACGFSGREAWPGYRFSASDRFFRSGRKKEIMGY